MHTNYALFEAFDNKYYNKIFFDTETGGFVVAHKEHGRNELKGNKVIALRLAALGKRVILLPNQINVISADADVDSEIWEFKTLMTSTNLRSAIQVAIRRAKLQSCNILCFINQLYVIEEITAGIDSAVRNDKSEKIARIAVLFEDGKIIDITREEILQRQFAFKFYQ
jgi:hypothetical protein